MLLHIPFISRFYVFCITDVCVDCPSVKGIRLGSYAYVDQSENIFFEGALFFF